MPQTPFLIVQSGLLEKNLAMGAELVRRAGGLLRPHAKSHKCAAIAGRQMALGAVGLTVATLGEAEAFHQEGFSDLFLAYPIVQAEGLKRAAELAKTCRLAVAMDNPGHVALMGEVARAAEVRIGVRLEIDSGQHRCGLEPGPALVSLAGRVAAHPGLVLEGVFTHAGHAYGATQTSERRDIASAEARSVAHAAELLIEAGLPCEIRSVGSTPTLPFAPELSGLMGVGPPWRSGPNEWRPGNYVFFDMIQVALGVATPEQCALQVETSVIGAFSDRIVIDAGSKSLGLDRGAHGLDMTSGFGWFPAHPDWHFARVSEEHGIVILPPGTIPSPPGSRLRLIPNHACAVVNLHSWLWYDEDGRAGSPRPIIGRR